MKLSAAQRRYIIRNQVLSSVVINFLINALFGWLFYHASSKIALLHALQITFLPNSIALDLIPTTFFLVFFTNLIVSRHTGHFIRTGRLPPLTVNPYRFCLGRPCQPMASLQLAIVLTALLVPLTVALLYSYDIRELALWPFIGFKALYASVLAALFTPFVVIRSLTEMQIQ